MQAHCDTSEASNCDTSHSHFYSRVCMRINPSIGVACSTRAVTQSLGLCLVDTGTNAMFVSYLGHWFCLFFSPCNSTPHTGHGASTRLILLKMLIPREKSSGPTVTTWRNTNIPTWGGSRRTAKAFFVVGRHRRETLLHDISGTMCCSLSLKHGIRTQSR